MKKLLLLLLIVGCDPDEIPAHSHIGHFSCILKHNFLDQVMFEQFSLHGIVLDNLPVIHASNLTEAIIKCFKTNTYGDISDSTWCDCEIGVSSGFIEY